MNKPKKLAKTILVSIRCFFTSYYFLSGLIIANILSLFVFEYLGASEDFLFVYIIASYFFIIGVIALISFKIFRIFGFIRWVKIFFMGLLIISMYIEAIGGVVYDETQFLISFSLGGIWVGIMVGGILRSIFNRIWPSRKMELKPRVGGEVIIIRKTWDKYIKIFNKAITKKKAVLSSCWLSKFKMPEMGNLKKIDEEVLMRSNQFEAEFGTDLKMARMTGIEKKIYLINPLGKFSCYFEAIYYDKELIDYITVYLLFSYYFLPILGLVMIFDLLFGFNGSLGSIDLPILILFPVFLLWWYRNMAKINVEVVKLVRFLSIYKYMDKKTIRQMHGNKKINKGLFVTGSIFLYLFQLTLFNYVAIYALSNWFNKQAAWLEIVNEILIKNSVFLGLIFLILVKPMIIYGKMKEYNESINWIMSNPE